MGYSDNVEAKQNIDMVRAIDAANIVVRIPQDYRDDPVGFASDLLDTPIDEPEPESRVVINPRAGTIVISGDVEIGDVIVSHKNVVVEAAAAPARFAAIDVDQSSQPQVCSSSSTSSTRCKVPTRRHDRDHSRHRAERQTARAS